MVFDLEKCNNITELQKISGTLIENGIFAGLVRLSLMKVSSRKLLLHKVPGAYRPGIVSHLMPPSLQQSLIQAHTHTHAHTHTKYTYLPFLFASTPQPWWKSCPRKVHSGNQGAFCRVISMERTNNFFWEGLFLSPEKHTSCPGDLKCTQPGERDTSTPLLVQLKFIQDIERQQRTSSSTVIN